jgi:hypothetical protein
MGEPNRCWVERWPSACSPGAGLEGVYLARRAAAGTGYADPGAGADAVADADHALRAAFNLQVNAEYPNPDYSYPIRETVFECGLSG